MYVPGAGVVEEYNVTLEEWITDPPTGSSPTPLPIYTDTLVFGINVGVGSGWNDTFLGYVDNVLIEFNGDDGV